MRSLALPVTLLALLGASGALTAQPIGSFELTLPQGKYSALAANGNLCTSKLAMPTEFLAQNGAKINASTKVGVKGCSKAKKKITRKTRSNSHKGRN